MVALSCFLWIWARIKIFYSEWKMDDELCFLPFFVSLCCWLLLHLERSKVSPHLTSPGCFLSCKNYCIIAPFEFTQWQNLSMSNLSIPVPLPSPRLRGKKLISWPQIMTHLGAATLNSITLQAAHWPVSLWVDIVTEGYFPQTVKGQLAGYRNVSCTPQLDDRLIIAKNNPLFQCLLVGKRLAKFNGYNYPARLLAMSCCFISHMFSLLCHSTPLPKWNSFSEMSL